MSTTYDLTEDEIDLLKSLSPYPRFYPVQYNNSLTYFESVKLASRHPGGWAKGSYTDRALVELQISSPPRIKQCRGCGA